MPGDFKGAVQYYKKLMWGYILAQDEHFTNFSFWISLKQKLLFLQKTFQKF